MPMGFVLPLLDVRDITLGNEERGMSLVFLFYLKGQWSKGLQQLLK